MAGSTASSLQQAARLWWIHHGEKAGLALAVALIAVFAIAVLSPTRRHDPFVHTGLVTGFGSSSTETGTEIYARVYVDRRATTVQIDAHHNCVVGSHIALRKVYYGSGEFYFMHPRGCGPATR